MAAPPDSADSEETSDTVRLPQIPVDDVSATAVQNAAQVIKRPADVDVRHVDVPPARRGRTHRHNVGVQHHKPQPPVALQRVLQMEADDGLLLPILQPEIAGNPAVVLVHLAVAFPPVVKLTGFEGVIA